MDILKRIKGILAEPSKFFNYLVKQKNKKEKGLGNAFVYFLALSAFATILGSIIGWIFQPVWISLAAKFIPMFEGLAIPRTPIVLMALFAVLGYIIGIVASFIWAAILHVWILIFGGKENYTETYKLSVYSRTPGFVFGWIPVVGWFTWIWSLVLLIIGTQKMQKISRLRAVLMYVIPVMVFYALMIAFLIWAFIMLAQVLPGMLETLPQTLPVQ